MILLDFFEILLKFRWNFWKFHGNPLNLQISMNFRGCRDKTRPETRQETQRRPVVLPLRGAEVLVAVRGPSPGPRGGGKNIGYDAGPRRARPCCWSFLPHWTPVGDTTADRQNFGKMLLVFGCIGTDFCKKIRVLQQFSKSTRLSSWIFLKYGKILQISRHLQNFAEFSQKMLIFQTDFCENFEIAAVQRMQIL